MLRNRADRKRSCQSTHMSSKKKTSDVSLDDHSVRCTIVKRSSSTGSKQYKILGHSRYGYAWHSGGNPKHLTFAHSA